MARDSHTVWALRIREAAGIPETLALLRERLLHGDVDGSAPVDAIIKVGKADRRARLRFDQAIVRILAGDDGRPVDEARRSMLRSLLHAAAELRLTAASWAVMSWMDAQEDALRHREGLELGRAALRAVARAQPPGVADFRAFWLRIWRDGPPRWWSRAFKGLARQDLAAAVSELSLLAERGGTHAGPLVHDLWRLPNGREALLDVLGEHAGSPWCQTLRAALEPLLQPDERAALPSVAASQSSPELLRGRSEEFILDASERAELASPPSALVSALDAALGGADSEGPATAAATVAVDPRDAPPAAVVVDPAPPAPAAATPAVAPAEAALGALVFEQGWGAEADTDEVPIGATAAPKTGDGDSLLPILPVPEAVAVEAVRAVAEVAEPAGAGHVTTEPIALDHEAIAAPAAAAGVIPEVVTDGGAVPPASPPPRLAALVGALTGAELDVSALMEQLPALDLLQIFSGGDPEPPREEAG